MQVTTNLEQIFPRMGSLSRLIHQKVELCSKQLHCWWEGVDWHCWRVESFQKYTKGSGYHSTYRPSEPFVCKEYIPTDDLMASNCEGVCSQRDSSYCRREELHGPWSVEIGDGGKILWCNPVWTSETNIIVMNFLQSFADNNIFAFNF